MFRVLSQLSNSTVNGVRESAVIAIEEKRRRTTLNVSVKEGAAEKNEGHIGKYVESGRSKRVRETWKDVIKETKGWRCDKGKKTHCKANTQ